MKVEGAIREAVSWLHDTKLATEFIEKVYKVYPRYIRDHIRLLKKSITLHGVEKTSTAMKYCMEKNIFSTVDLISVAEKIKISRLPEGTIPQLSGASPARMFGVEKRPLDIYQAVMADE